jgi:outer membrane protein assembly factor BamB
MSTAKKALKGVTIHNPDRVYDGYTLLAPLGGYNAWLVNNDGEICHHWALEHQPAFFGRVLPNGNLIYQGMEELDPQGPVLKVLDANGNVVVNLVMGGGEYLVELDWEGNKVWEYRNALLNHDFYRMDNGNTMAICYEMIPDELKHKTKGGISLGDDVDMWADKLVEINPQGEIVWEWKCHEHLDFETDVYCPLEHRAEWTHMNTCTVLPDGDILGSFRTLDLIVKIDKKTGDVVWRFGSGKIAHQHEPTLMDNGNILVFDNGEHRKYSKYSYTRLIEIDPATGKIVWEYKDDPPFSWFCGCQGGCQRLPNGNTIISDTMIGRVFEVTHDGETVWEYMSPFYGPHGFEEPNVMIYRVYKYGKDFEGFKGKTLDPKKYEWVNRLFGPEALKKIK